MQINVQVFQAVNIDSNTFIIFNNGIFAALNRLVSPSFFDFL